MTAADIARLQDGRVTPENVRPRAKNPIIAGFFREATGSSMYCVKGESEKALHGSESGY